MSETRVISSKPKIGARPGGGAVIGEKPSAEKEPEAKAKKKLSPKVLVPLLLVLLLGGGAGYWFFLGPGAGPAAEKVEPAPVPGEVLTVEAISINLAQGHYLRLGLGLQLTDEVTEAPDTARALDLAISLFSGRTVAEASDPATREALKAELLHQLTEAYEGEVMDVYFTDYVTQ